MVNDSEEKTFYVLHDDGDVMTLQQREDIIGNSSWYSARQDNTKGPLTALEALEAATNGWSNVNTINYTMGTTNYGTDLGYWTMNAYSSASTLTWIVNYYGHLHTFNTTTASLGARAVVVINK